MLNCEKCNYIKRVGSKEAKGVHFCCELTGFMFKKDFQDYDMDNHPCFNYNPQEIGIEDESIAS
jgi:hypothetical protein